MHQEEMTQHYIKLPENEFHQSHKSKTQNNEKEKNAGCYLNQVAGTGTYASLAPDWAPAHTGKL